MSGIEKVLIVSSSESGQQFVSEMLSSKDFFPAAFATSGAQARQLLDGGDNFDMVIVNAPLSDEFGHELACLATRLMAGAIILVKSERAEDVAARVENEGVFVIAKPVSRPMFLQALNIIRVSHRYTAKLCKENRKLQNGIEEIRLIDRAKCALIQCLLMTEPQAHRYLEKQAMDLRLTRREVAENILKTYEI